MKKILFLSYNIKLDYEYFGKTYKNTSELFKDYLFDYQVDFFDYKSFNMVEDVPYIFNQKLSNYSFVFFGFISNFTNEAEIVLSYVKSSCIPYMKYGNFKYKDSKAYEMKLIKEAGLPYIPTLLFNELDKRILSIIKGKTYPLIAKPIYGSKGNGVTLLENNKDLRMKLSLISTPTLIQPFIENDCDYRVIVINNKVQMTIKRSRQKDTKEFRNNIYLGSKFEKSELPEDILKKLEIFSHQIDCNILGFDILWNGTDWYIMEYNSAPTYLKFAQELKIDLAEKICTHIKSRI